MSERMREKDVLELAAEYGLPLNRSTVRVWGDQLCPPLGRKAKTYDNPDRPNYGRTFDAADIRRAFDLLLPAPPPHELSEKDLPERHPLRRQKPGKRHARLNLISFDSAAESPWKLSTSFLVNCEQDGWIDNQGARDKLKVHRIYFLGAHGGVRRYIDRSAADAILAARTAVPPNTHKTTEQVLTGYGWRYLDLKRWEKKGHRLMGDKGKLRRLRDGKTWHWNGREMQRVDLWPVGWLDELQRRLSLNTEQLAAEGLAPDPKLWASTREARNFLGVAKRQVYEWADEGCEYLGGECLNHLWWPGKKEPGAERYFDWDHLRKIKETRTAQPPRRSQPDQSERAWFMWDDMMRQQGMKLRRELQEAVAAGNIERKRERMQLLVRAGTGGNGKAKRQHRRSRVVWLYSAKPNSNGQQAAPQVAQGLTVSEAALSIDVPKGQITKLCDAGRIASTGKGRARRVDANSLARYKLERDRERGF